MAGLNEIRVESEIGRIRSRDVQYFSGSCEAVHSRIPDFILRDYKAKDDLPPHPYLKSVCRLPLTHFEREMPVGVVSNSYTLAEHRKVFDLCLKGMLDVDLKKESIEATCGLSELGEWMNLRLYFPEDYDYISSDNSRLRLRLECFNSVDGSARLVILLGWYRIICANGMIIGESKAEFQDVHDGGLDISEIPKVIAKGMRAVNKDRLRMKTWENHRVTDEAFKLWVNGPLSSRWGKKAASRVYWICEEGHDTCWENPFQRGIATEKEVKRINPVPGSQVPCDNVYGIAQSMAWVSTNTNNLQRRTEMQLETPKLLKLLK